MKVVLLHALPLDERMWERQREGLSDLDLATPRLYGRGNTIDEWGRSILAEVEGNVVVAGASMGGYCALSIAREAPDRVLGVVLSGSRTDADSDERRAARAGMLERIHEDGAKGLWELMRDRLFPKDAPDDVVRRAEAIALEQKPEELVAAVEAIRDRDDSTDVARSYGDRLLVVVGEEDPFVSVEEARAFSTGSEAVFLGTGHLPNMEHPERWNHVLRDFVSRWT